MLAKQLKTQKPTRKVKKPKTQSKKYSETGAAAYKKCYAKIKQSCTKYQKYHDEITKNMKSLLQENFW